MKVSRNDHETGQLFPSQVDRILRSETFRSSDVLQRLLKFLSEKYISGEADNLKEYTVAIEALERPSTYDPRRDSTVRIQMGRLRQKLADYYRSEGRDDPTIIDLPKGRFGLTCASRSLVVESASVSPKTGRVPKLIWAAGLLWLALLIMVGLMAYSAGKHEHTEVLSLPGNDGWDGDLEALWKPFIATNRPLILAVEDPLFIALPPSKILYRDTAVNKWEDLTNTADTAGLRNVPKNSNAHPMHYYTPFGEANTSFLLGKMLGTRVHNMSLVRTSELSWQQLADNNIVFVGREIHFHDQMQGMPLLPQLVPNSDGIRNLRPLKGEPATFVDQRSVTDGEVYALVTHLPGPLGSGDIETFTSSVSSGYMGAVQWFTQPESAHTLVEKLRKSSGEIPRYYQIVLKVRFKDQVPTQTSLVLSRELK